MLLLQKVDKSKVLSNFDGSINDVTQDQRTFNQQCFMRDADGKIESPNLSNKYISYFG